MGHLGTEESGYQRFSSINATTFSTQGLGNEFGSIETLLGQTIDDIFIWGAEAYFSIGGQIGLASWSAQDYEWELRDNSILSLEGASLSSPTLVRKDEDLFMVLVAEDETGSWIARAGQGCWWKLAIG